MKKITNKAVLVQVTADDFVEVVVAALPKLFSQVVILPEEFGLKIQFFCDIEKIGETTIVGKGGKMETFEGLPLEENRKKLVGKASTVFLTGIKNAMLSEEYSEESKFYACVELVLPPKVTPKKKQ